MGPAFDSRLTHDIPMIPVIILFFFLFVIFFLFSSFLVYMKITRELLFLSFDLL